MGFNNLAKITFALGYSASRTISQSTFIGSNSVGTGAAITRHGGRPSPEQRVILKEHRKLIEDAFAQLTPKQRQCVLLRAEGFRYREIALILKISVQRVGELMQRSIDLLEVHP